ncbi:MAG: hypothetical protein ACLFQE_06250, partial [Thermotogota bacterium]
MKRMIGISILLVMVTLMSFAGGFGFNQKGVMAGEAHEIARLEKEYQFYSLLNAVGFTQGQLEQIIGAAEKARASILSIESDVKAYLERAIELVKAGDVDKAREKHEEAMEAGKEVVVVRQTYMDTLKGIITVEQQEKFMDYLSSTMQTGMERVREHVVDSERFKQLPEVAKEKMQQMGTVVKKVMEQRDSQRAPQMRVQPTARSLMNQNVYTGFFNMLLIENNLDLMK